MNWLITLVELVGSGGGVWLATEAVKAAKFIPINEGQKIALRATAAVLSAGGVLLLGLVNDTLKPDDVQGIVTAVLGLGIAWGTAHGVHKKLN